ncbi:MAG: hypothetical protein L3J17_06910 [Candidatus Jettenia sp.]|nr:MAG: hypothetical protein L3J17_06910 [Candidatus Jettenia sp.]
MKDEAFRWLSEPRQCFSDWEPPAALRGSSFAKRRMFFERHETHSKGNAVCPACGYPTLRYRNGYDYCSLCHWEDDGQDDPWADQPNGGPNDHSLSEARRNFRDTYCVWSNDEAKDFSPTNQERLFSEAAQREKRILCSLYDGLMDLQEARDIEKQWELIEKQWKSVP